MVGWTRSAARAVGSGVWVARVWRGYLFDRDSPLLSLYVLYVCFAWRVTASFSTVKPELLPDLHRFAPLPSSLQAVLCGAVRSWRRKPVEDYQTSSEDPHLGPSVRVPV